MVGMDAHLFCLISDYNYILTQHDRKLVAVESYQC